MIVGAAGVGKSSLANALLGCDPKSPHGCLFPVCPGSPYVCTNQTTVGTGSWLGTGQPFTVTDTPGFGVSSDRDRSLMQEMSLVLDKKLGYTDTIVLVLEANTRLSSGLVDMLNTFSSTLGSDWWDSVVIGVSKWKYSQARIEERRENCEHYPEYCRDEEWFVREINSWLKDMFRLERDLPFVFIEAFSQTRGNIQDQVQQEYFQRETEKLWDLSTGSGQKFQFSTIEDKCRMAEKENQITELKLKLKSVLEGTEGRLSEKDNQITDLKQTTSELESQIAERDTRISVLEEYKSESEARVDGGWGRWRSWSSCSVSCGGGTQYRTRPCDSPSPSNTGVYCQGEPFQYQDCHTRQCPMKGMILIWIISSSSQK